MKDIRDNHTKREERPASLLSKLENMHPHQMLFNLAMGSVFIAFAFLTLSMAAARLERLGVYVAIPTAFYLSFAVLNLTSWTIYQFNRAFRQADFERAIRWSWAALGLVVLFILCQTWGIWDLTQGKHLLNEEVKIRNYIYVLTSLHSLHVVVGAVILAYRIHWLKTQQKDPVKILVVETNPYQKLMTSLVAQYWHIMTFLWWMIFIYFL